jgi:hypothetical protein
MPAGRTTSGTVPPAADHGVIAEITTFDARLFPAFGLPPTH